MSAKGKIIKKARSESLKQQWTRDTLKGDLSVQMTLYHGTKTLRDIDNYTKLPLDCMTGIVYEDDSQIQMIYIEKKYDKLNPRVEIEIVEF